MNVFVFEKPKVRRDQGCAADPLCTPFCALHTFALAPNTFLSPFSPLNTSCAGSGADALGTVAKAPKKQFSRDTINGAK